MSKILQKNLVEKSEIAFNEFQNAKMKFTEVLTDFIFKINSGDIIRLEADLKNDREGVNNESCEVQVERKHMDFLVVCVRGKFLAKPKRKDNTVRLSHCLTESMRLCIYTKLLNEKVDTQYMQYEFKILYFTFEITSLDGKICEVVQIGKKILEQAPSHT